jgi:hypothetical protein
MLLNPSGKISLFAYSGANHDSFPIIMSPKRKIIRTLVMNCQSIKNKRCELQATTEYIKLDIIIGNESWLAPEYANSEIFPEGFNSMVYRNDRYKNCGGAFISVRDGYTTSEINQGSSN